MCWKCWRAIAASIPQPACYCSLLESLPLWNQLTCGRSCSTANWGWTLYCPSTNSNLWLVLHFSRVINRRTTLRLRPLHTKDCLWSSSTGCGKKYPLKLLTIFGATARKFNWKFHTFITKYLKFSYTVAKVRTFCEKASLFCTLLFFTLLRRSTRSQTPTHSFSNIGKNYDGKTARL